MKTTKKADPCKRICLLYCVVSGLLLAAAAGGAAFLSGAAAIGTTNALVAALFCFDNVQSGKADNDQQHCNKNDIRHGGSSLL